MNQEYSRQVKKSPQDNMFQLDTHHQLLLLRDFVTFVTLCHTRSLRRIVLWVK